MNNLDKLANKYAAKRLQETASIKPSTKTPLFNDGIKSKETSANGSTLNMLRTKKGMVEFVSDDQGGIQLILTSFTMRKVLTIKDDSLVADFEELLDNNSSDTAINELIEDTLRSNKGKTRALVRETAAKKGKVDTADLPYLDDDTAKINAKFKKDFAKALKTVLDRAKADFQKLIEQRLQKFLGIKAKSIKIRHEGDSRNGVFLFADVSLSPKDIKGNERVLLDGFTHSLDDEGSPMLHNNEYVVTMTIGTRYGLMFDDVK